MATFKLRANELSGLTGLYVYLYPLGGTLANAGGDALSESSGLFTATVSEPLSGVHDYYIGTSTIDVLYRGRVDCEGSVWVADSLDVDYLVDIKAKSDLIGTANGTTNFPVSASGKITTIFQGDDYLSANGRAFQWTITAPTGFTAESSTCSFGGADANGNAWLVSGSISNSGGSWVLAFDLPKTATEDLPLGIYEWTVEVKSALGVEHTVSFGGDTRLRRKYT